MCVRVCVCVCVCIIPSLSLPPPHHHSFFSSATFFLLVFFFFFVCHFFFVKSNSFQLCIYVPFSSSSSSSSSSSFVFTSSLFISSPFPLLVFLLHILVFISLFVLIHFHEFTFFYSSPGFPSLFLHIPFSLLPPKFSFVLFLIIYTHAFFILH